MRFMMLVKHSENQSNPPKALMDAITEIAVEAAKKGNMLGSGGLAPTAQSVRVRVSGGQLRVIDGPFTEAKEVIGGYAQFEFKSKEEAIQSAVEFMDFTASTGRDGRARPKSASCLGRKMLPRVAPLPLFEGPDLVFSAALNISLGPTAQ